MAKLFYLKGMNFGIASVALLVNCSLFRVVLHGQYAEDALRFSVYNLQGSSRFVGMGGAMGAVGADFTTASYKVR